MEAERKGSGSEGKKEEATGNRSGKPKRTDGSAGSGGNEAESVEEREKGEPR